MRYSQDFIEKVRDANNIVEIIGQYTELKGSGHRQMGRCPFPDHSDKSPSFSVTEDNQLYYCYGCKKGGNVFTFLETYNGMSFPEAVEFLARRASIALPEPEEKPGQRKPAFSSEQKDLYLKINRTAAVYFHHNLKGTPENHSVRAYMAKRGLSDEIVEKFRLGLTTDEWQGLGKLLESKGAPLKAAEALGLLKPKKNPPRSGPLSEGYFDLFRERLMFPIFSPTGDVIGFGGRTLGDALPKYVNSSDSPVFNKSRVLYGLHETGKFIRAQDEAIVVEGYMDAISLYAAGIKNVVAILGTAFTADHAKLLKRYTLNVKMLLDGDEAGINAAERSLPFLLEAGLLPKGIVLPEKMDPDDYVKANGAEALKQEIDRAPELFSLLLTKRWMASYHGLPSEKVQIIDEAARSMRAMQNQKLFELYAMELSRQLDTDLGWVRRSLIQSIQQFNAAQKPAMAPKAGVSPQEIEELLEPNLESEQLTEKPRERVVMKGAPKDEAFVLSLLLHEESLLKELVAAGPEELLQIFSHAGVTEVIRRAVARFQKDPGSHSHIAAALVDEVDLPGVFGVALPFVGEYKSKEQGEEVIRKTMGDYLSAIRNRFLKRQAKEIASQLKAGASPEKLAEIQNLNRDRLGREGQDTPGSGKNGPAR